MLAYDNELFKEHEKSISLFFELTMKQTLINIKIPFQRPDSERKNGATTIYQ